MLNARPTPAVAGSYLIGAVLGALASAAVLLVLAGLLSPIPLRWRAIALLVILSGLALRALGVVRVPLPQNSRQIPREVFMSRPASAAFRFAFELGTSVRTYITKEAPYALAVAVLLVLPHDRLISDVGLAALAGLGFGAGRALIVSSQMLRTAVIVEHPGWALSVANWLAIAGAAGLAVSRLV